MEVITVTNQKGGVGKTTTANILACGLCNAGFKVLVVDADPQTNLTYTAGVTPEEVEISLYEMFRNPSSLQVLKSPLGFDLIAGSLNLAGADLEFSFTGREYLLKKILTPVKEKYDFCIIDTPPTLGILTVNALTVSDSVIVPMKADIYSIQGLAQLLGMIENVKEYTNPAIKIEGLLITQNNARATLNKELKESIEETALKLNTKVFKASIREGVAIRESAFLKVDIFKAYPKAKVTEDYKSFLEEFLIERR